MPKANFPSFIVLGQTIPHFPIRKNSLQVGAISAIVLDIKITISRQLTQLWLEQVMRPPKNKQIWFGQRNSKDWYTGAMSLALTRGHPAAPLPPQVRMIPDWR